MEGGRDEADGMRVQDILDFNTATVTAEVLTIADRKGTSFSAE